MSTEPFLFFDLDGTLLDHPSASREAALHLRVAFPSLARIDEATFLDDWVALTERHMDRYFAGHVDFVTQRRARMRELLSWVGEDLDDGRADEAFDIYLEAYRRRWRLYADALPCLDALAADGARLGVITNGGVEAQTRKLERTGILARFEVVVITGALGVHKPDPRVFEVAATRAGRPASGCVYVGDKLETDARGARAAGMRGVWLDRARGEDPPGDVEVIHSLADPLSWRARRSAAR